MSPRTALLCALAFCLAAPARPAGAQFPDAQNARAIIEKADDLMRGKTLRAEMSLEIVRPDWSRRLAFKFWSKGRDYTLTYISAPAKEKGQAFLKRENELWNWVPAINRMVKVPPSMMGQSWMGSDFTNDDLIKESSVLADFDHALAGEDTLAGRPCWKIELTPKEDAAVVWGRVLTWVDRDTYIQYRIERYDEDLELVNTQTAGQVRQMGGRLIATRLEIVPADNPDQRTVMTVDKAVFDEPLPGRFFSQQNLKRVR